MKIGTVMGGPNHLQLLAQDDPDSQQEQRPEHDVQRRREVQGPRVPRPRGTRTTCTPARLDEFTEYWVDTLFVDGAFRKGFGYCFGYF